MGRVVTEPNKREYELMYSIAGTTSCAYDAASEVTNYREYLLQEVEKWMADVYNPDLEQREGFTRMIRRLRDGT